MLAEKHIGVFYGYAIELNGDRFVSLSHLDYEGALDIPGLDFLISPGTYRDRIIGGGSGFMTPNGTVRIKDKAFMHECDQRTHTYKPNLTPFVSLHLPHWPDETATIAGLRREMALALINRASLWWFDMWGGFCQGEAIFDNFRLMNEIWQRYAGEEFEPTAEVALIIDPDSCLYLHPTDSDKNSFLNGMQDDSYLHGLRDKLNRLVAPYDIFSMNDIPVVDDLKRYKLVIFCTPFEIDDAKGEMLRQHVLCDQRTVVWLTAPGISDGRQWCPERGKEWAGVDYQTPGLNTVAMDAWQSVLASSPADLSPAVFKELVAKAGVALYCQEELPVYANSRLVAIHTAEGGELTVTLLRSYKKITELFTGAVVGQNTNSFTHCFPKPGTCLFEVE